MPGNRGAPIMADNDGLPFPKCNDQRDHIADMIEDAVSIDLRGGTGSAKAPHVRCGDTEARRRYRRDLIPPGIGQFRPAVAEHHQRTFALFKQEYLDPVGGNGA